MEEISKSLEQKNIIERHTNSEGKFNLSTSLLEADRNIKALTERVAACEEALTFFSEWYNKTQRANILLPDSLDESGNTKLIL
jgi:DNA-binding MarR family transcriptional regulator